MIKIIGTGHVLQKSVNEVRETILAIKPDFVAVELDRKRYEILKENNFELNFEEAYSHYSVRDLFSSPAGLIQYLLANLQREFGKKLNVFPGSEMKEAILCAKEINANIILIDRNIDVTMNRILNLPLNEKLKMLTLSPKMTKDIDIDFEDGINSILDPKNLEKITNIMKKFPKFYKGLVEERDAYMAMNLYSLQLRFPYANIVAVVGAGHNEGIEKFLNKFENEKVINVDINTINKVEKISRLSHFTNILFAFILIVALIFLKLRFR